MALKLCVVGAGQFAAEFLPLFRLHPGVDKLYVTDLRPERAKAAAEEFGLDGVLPSFEEALASQCDSVAIFTQRWSHGPLVLRALEAGKHVYSTVPMATTYDEVASIIAAVRATGLTYMMGETSYYNPACIYARQRRDSGDFGRLFYSEGDYIHDMKIGFYKAYQYSGGERWRETASFPPMLYPTHSIGGVLSVVPSHAVSVSCLGVPDQTGDGVFDRSVSRWDNDISNASALFELADGGIMRTNEMRRAGYPTLMRESRFRFFGTEGSFEQVAGTSLWQDRRTATNVEPLLAPVDRQWDSRCGYAPIHDTGRLPASYAAVPNAHEGSHPFLADDFVKSVLSGTLPPVNAWTAARYTLPGITAHESARQGGPRLVIPDLGGPEGHSA